MTSNKRPIHVVHYRDDENLINRRYTYNRMDHTTAETRIDDFGLTDTFLYDSSYRLYGARYDEGGTPEAIREDLASSVYVLDGPGNRRQTEHTFRSGETTTEVYQVNEMNEYTQVGPVDFAHDDNGNLLDDDAHLYGYDYRNRLIKVSRTGDTAPVARYTYDVLDRRRGKWLFDPNAPGADPTRRLFLYDFSRRIVEETGAGGAERGYVYGADPDLPFNMYTTDLVPGGLNSYYLHEIPWRSVVGVTDRMGEVVDHTRYFAYGERSPMSNVGNPFLFRAGFDDAETGLVLMNGRHYNPKTGRHLSRAPSSSVTNLQNPYPVNANRPATDTTVTEAEQARRNSSRGTKRRRRASTGRRGGRGVSAWEVVKGFGNGFADENWVKELWNRKHDDYEEAAVVFIERGDNPAEVFFGLLGVAISDVAGSTDVAEGVVLGDDLHERVRTGNYVELSTKERVLRTVVGGVSVVSNAVPGGPGPPRHKDHRPGALGGCAGDQARLSPSHA